MPTPINTSGTAAAVVQGIDHLYIQDSSGASTPVVADSNAIDWTNWTKFGFKQNESATDFSYKGEFAEKFVDEHNAPIGVDLVGEELLLAFALAEAKMDWLQYSMAGGTFTAGAIPGTNEDKLELGDKAAVAEWALGVSAPSETGILNSVLYVPKAYANNDFSWAFKRREVRGTPLGFKAMADTTLDAGTTLATLYNITLV